jgi:hypothetical protein
MHKSDASEEVSAKCFSGNRLQNYAPRRYSILFYSKFMHIKDNIGGLGGGMSEEGV